jgi:hypothetical protein
MTGRSIWRILLLALSCVAGLAGIPTGWTTHQIVGRPKARFFGSLSVLWFFLSILAAIPIWADWPKRFTRVDWLCVAVVAAHLVFIVLAIVFWLTEQPRTFTERHIE